MQATFGKQVLYTEKFSLCFFKETERRERRPLLFLSSCRAEPQGEVETSRRSRIL